MIPPDSHEPRTSPVPPPPTGEGGVASSWGAWAAAARPLGPGDRIGRYRIIEEIGRGGFGVVYRAEQREPIERQVAVKMILVGMDTEGVVARFEAERQALALMNHPNVATVFDGGATEAGRPYFAMEYVAGVPITAYCDQHRLNVPDRLMLFMQVCDALQHAHQKGIIHRDIKPSNILVTVKEDAAIVKVIDFGVAKAISRRLTERTIFTRLGQFIGTPEYMSPEQAEMAGLDIDTRTDVYALGVLLYELLVGARPIDPESLRAKGFDEIRRMICEVDPARPSTRFTSLGPESEDLARARRTNRDALARELRRDLDWVTMRAMEKDRTRRYASASELAADLRRFLRHEPVTAGPPQALYRVGKLMRRHRAATVAAGAVLAALVLGVVATSWQALRARRAELQATAYARSSRREAYLARISAADAAVNATEMDMARRHLERAPPEYRGWEWRFLSRRSEGSLAVLRGHAAGVLVVAAGPHGRLIASGSVDQTIMLWDARTGGHRATLTGHTAPVCSVVFAPDGSYLVSASYDGTIRRWDVASGAGRLLARDAYERQDALALSPDGRVLAAGRADIGIDFRDPATGALRRRFAAGPGVPALAFSPDGTLIAAGYQDGTIRVYGTRAGIERRRWSAHRNWILSVAFSPDGARLATASVDQFARCWELASPAPIAEFRHRAAVRSVAFSPSGRLLLTASHDRTVGLWPLSGEPAAALRGHEDKVYDAAFVPGTRALVSASVDGTLRIWDARPGPHREALTATNAPPPAPVTGASISDDGRWIVSVSSASRIVRLFDAERRREVRVLGRRGRCARISPDGEAVVIGDDAGALYVVAAGDDHPLASLPGPGGGPVTALAVSGDGGYVAWGGRDGGVRSARLDLDDPALVHRFEHAVTALAFDATGGLLAAGGNGNGAVDVWPREGPNAIMMVDPVGAEPTALAFAPGGAELAVGTYAGPILRLDRNTAARSAPRPGHRQAITALRYLPDGSRLFSASQDNTVRVWDTADGASVLVLRGHGNWVTALDLSAEGERLVSASLDRSVRLWEAGSAR